MTIQRPVLKHPFMDLARHGQQIPGDLIQDQVIETHRAVDQVIEELAALQTKAPVAPQRTSVVVLDQRNNVAMLSENSAENWSVASWHWAEHMPGPLPAESVAAMGITGDHWSSRWWSNQALLYAKNANDSANDAAESADILTAFEKYYLGPKPFPPTTDNNGGPLLEGAMYFDTGVDQMRVWDGTKWISTSPAPATSAANVISSPVGGVSANNVQLAIGELDSEKATRTELNAAVASLDAEKASHDDLDAAIDAAMAALAIAVSDSAPVGSGTGQLWYDSDNGRLFIRVDNSWVQVKGS
jgi:hypothetical protein